MVGCRTITRRSVLDPRKSSGVQLSVDLDTGIVLLEQNKQDTLVQAGLAKNWVKGITIARTQKNKDDAGTAKLLQRRWRDGKG